MTHDEIKARAEAIALCALRWWRGDDNRYLFLSVPSLWGRRRFPTLVVYFFMFAGRPIALTVHRKPYEYRWVARLANRICCT